MVAIVAMKIFGESSIDSHCRQRWVILRSIYRQPMPPTKGFELRYIIAHWGCPTASAAKILTHRHATT